MGEPEKEKWDTEKMREVRSNWSLAADTQLLSCMHQFSQNLLSKTHSTLKSFDSLESEVANTCVQVGNIGNRFWALSDTQFVESRVYDDDDVTSPTSPTAEQEQPKKNIECVIVDRLTEAIKNGIQVLDTKFETIEVSASDSDEEEDSSPHSGVVLKPVNRYKHRPLPHLIGSAEFRTDHTLGLREAPSDEDTDDFLSASDKESGESEDSDIECDQPQIKDIEKNEEKVVLRPPGLSVTENSHRKPEMTPFPAGDIFGEPEDNDLFSERSGKKSVFSNWQTSDLWAPDEESQKIMEDNTGSFRPPSADSSVSSAQSSIKSEPVKKTSEDFGKSGSGRQPVSIQDDKDDLFNTSTPAVTQAPATKKPIPAGGVRLFAADFNPFADNSLSRDASSKGLLNKPTQPNRQENNDENSDSSNVDQISNKPPVKNDKTSKIVPKKKDDLFNNSESDDDLFSSAKPTNINKSSNFHQQKPLFDSLSTKDSVTSKSTSSPFGSELNQSESDKEDDLFSSKHIFSKGYKHTENLFSDDLFSNDSSVFSSNVSVNPKSKIYKDTVGDDEPLFSNIDSSVKNISTNNVKSKIATDLFSDEVDLFGTTNESVADNWFATPSLSKNSDDSFKNTQKLPFSTASKPPSKGLFDDDEDDALFSSNAITTVPPAKRAVENSWLNNSKTNAPVFQSKQPPSKNENNMFSNQSQQTSEVDNNRVRKISGNLKPKKALERRSLFDSDSDDDLFSSPQGSLSSRKSLQASNTHVINKSEVGKQQTSSNLETNPTKTAKTDFSSIFSNDTSDGNIFSNSHKVSVVSADSLFEEEKYLFYKTNDPDVKTPDLFTNTTSQTIAKSCEPNKNSLVVSNSLKNEKTSSPEVLASIETVNSKLLLSSKEVSNKVPDISSELKTKLVSDHLNKPEIKHKKPEPPKSLGIKPILVTLSGASLKENASISEKSVLPKQSFNTSHTETTAPNDALDGEVISPPTPSKPKPGKLKASQLLNINTAALLPGAKPVQKVEHTPTSLEAEVRSNVLSEEILSPPDSTITSSSGSPLTFVSLSPPSTGSDSIVEKVLPPMPSLLPNVNKERAKIQGKRKPPTRQARQEAIRASSTEENSENSSHPPPPSSSLMSPSTDEEDLFSVPPLDVITDGVKPASPKTDIFGTPTVLSPNTKPELPSSFVSTPFVQLQPPPLEDDEEEEVYNHGEDVCEHEESVKYDIKHSQSKEVKTETKKKSITGDSSSNSQDDYLFSKVRDEPPPLTGDDEDDEEQEFRDLFISNKQTSNSVFSEESGNSLHISQNTFLNKSIENINEKTVCPSSDISVEIVTDDSLFAFDGQTHTENEDFLFFSNRKQHSLNGTENTLIKSNDLNSQLLYKYDNLKSSQLNSSNQKSIDDPLKNDFKKPHSVTIEKLVQSIPDPHINPKNNSLPSLNSSVQDVENNDGSNIPIDISTKLEDDDNQLFTQSTTTIRKEKHQPSEVTSEKSLHPVSNIFQDNANSYFHDDDDDALFSQPTVQVQETRKDTSLFMSDDSVKVIGVKSKQFTPTTSSTVSNETGIIKALSSSNVKSTESLPKNTDLRSSKASILSTDNEDDDDDYLFTSSTTIKNRSSKTTATSLNKETLHPSTKIVIDDEEKQTTDLFSNKGLQNIESKITKTALNKKQSFGKKSLFFEDNEDEESSDLFSAEKKPKIVAPSKSSLFGNDGDEDDIFGSTTFNNSDNLLKKTFTKAPPFKTSQPVAGSSKKGSKPGVPGSSKPVKLETTQTFSDPLLSNQD